MRYHVPDFLNTILQYDEHVHNIEQYLLDKTLPTDLNMRAKVLQDADSFALDTKQALVKKLKDGATAPYPCQTLNV